MNEEQIKEIFSDEAYVSSLLALETPEEVQTSLAEKGIDLTAAEITTLLDTIQKAQSDGELSEAALETVTGGLLTSLLILLFLAAVGMTGATMEVKRKRW